LAVVEVDCDWDCGSRGGVCGGADEEAVGGGYGPGEDLDYEGGAFGFCGADYSDDLLEVVAGVCLLVLRIGEGLFVVGFLLEGLTRSMLRLRSRLLRLL